MGHTYASNFLHCVFSTKQRASLIPIEVRENLWAYLSGIGANHNIEVLAVGGTHNHIHLLISIPPVVPLSKVINKLKSNSSHWLNEQGLDFAWQEGYGAFSVDASQLPAVKRYIRAQEQHHQKRNFEQEFLALLQRYGVSYNAAHVFG